MTVPAGIHPNPRGKLPEPSLTRHTMSWYRLLALIPVAALPLIISVYIVKGSEVIFGQAALMKASNLLFLSLIPFLVAGLAAKVHLAAGASRVLCIGTGLLAFGTACLLTAIGQSLEFGANFAVTVHNISYVLLAARPTRRSLPARAWGWLSPVGWSSLWAVSSLSKARWAAGRASASPCSPRKPQKGRNSLTIRRPCPTFLPWPFSWPKTTRLTGFSSSGP
jgi:hypothetical protein